MFSANDFLIEDHKQSGLRADELLYNLSREYKRTIVLIDRFFDNPLNQLIDDLSVPALSLPIDDPIFEADISRSPLLLELHHSTPAHVELLEESIRLAKEQGILARAPRICAWLSSNSTLNQIRDHLRQNLNAGYPTGESIYFRFFDPRVMIHLARIFSRKDSEAVQSNFSVLLALVDMWSHLDFQGNLISYKRVLPLTAAKSQAIRLDQETMDEIDRIGTLNLVIGELERAGVEYKWQDGEAIDRTILSAESIGISGQEDQIAYAWRAFYKGREFSEQAGLKRMIEQALMHGVPLENIFEEYVSFSTDKQLNSKAVRGN